MAPLAVFNDVRNKVMGTKDDILTKQLQSLMFARKTYTDVLKMSAGKFMTNIIKNYKDWVIVEDPILLKTYDTSVPRADQIKERCGKIGQETISMIEEVKKGVLGMLDPKAVYSMCCLCDDWNFIMSQFLFKIEYARLEFDSFARIKKMNESKRKYLWMSFLLIKVFIIEIIGNFDQMTNSKSKIEVKL